MKRRHEVLFNQLKTYRNETLEIIKGLSAEQAEMIPKGFHNNIRWNLGHIYLDQFLWIVTLTKDPIEKMESFDKWFAFGTSPQDFTSLTPSITELTALLKEQPDWIKARFAHRLEERFPPIEMGMTTIEQVLIRTIYHEGLHAQTIQLIKRFVLNS